MTMFRKVAAAALLLAINLAGFERARTQQPVVVHEWGTFTSVASETGSSVPWSPLVAPSDLPCFVEKLGYLNPKAQWTHVRMETPVLYFYSETRATLAVRVGFPSGWITEWYPRADSVLPSVPPGAVNPTLSVGNGSAEWLNVNVLPGRDADYPKGRADSHYYAARATDASPIQVGKQVEKFIFYRGIGNFESPVRPVLSNDRVALRNTSGSVIPLAILFENNKGRTGFRVVRNLGESAEIGRPELTGTVDALHGVLADVLTESGLYRKEALAMVETWRSSWFEEGLRVFYIVPKRLVDSLLPLDIKPAPAEIARVFVGRVEMLSPEMAERIEAVAVSSDRREVEVFGRFLQPFTAQMQRTTGRSLETSAMRSARNSVFTEWANRPSCIQ